MTPKPKIIPITKVSEWMRGVPVNKGADRALSAATEQAIHKGRATIDAKCLLEGLVRVRTPELALADSAIRAKMELDEISKVIKPKSIEGLTKLIKTILEQ